MVLVVVEAAGETEEAARGGQAKVAVMVVVWAVGTGGVRDCLGAAVGRGLVVKAAAGAGTAGKAEEEAAASEAVAFAWAGRAGMAARRVEN